MKQTVALIGFDDLDEVRRGRAFDQHGGSAEAQGEDRKSAEPEGEGDRRRTDEHVVGLNLEHLPRIDVGDDENVAMKVHRRLRRAGCSGGEAEQGDVVAARRHGGQGHRLIEREAVEFGVVIGGAVEADDAFEKAARLGAGDQFIEDPGVAQRKADLGLVDDLRQFSGAQHRHRVDHDRARLRRREPAGDHRGIVGRADEHAIAGLDAIILDERPGEPVAPVGKLLVGAAPAMADEGGAVAKAALDHAVGQLDRGVHVLWIIEPLQPKVGPLIGRRQVVARETVKMSGGTEHGFAPPTGAASEALALRICQSMRTRPAACGRGSARSACGVCIGQCE